MENKKKKTVKDILLIITICISGMVVVNDFPIFPAIEAIIADFPGISTFQINFMLTGPAFFVMFGSILSSWLVTKVGCRKVVNISMIVMTISTVFGATIMNIEFLMIMRAIAGFSAGVVGTAVTTLIANIYEDETERSKVFGLYNGVFNGIAMVLQIASGYLTLINWRYVYLLYLLYVPCLIGCFTIIPKSADAVKEVIAENSTEEDEFKISLLVRIVIMMLILQAVGGFISTKVAAYVTENGLGDASIAGKLGATYTLFSLFGGILFPVLYKWFKNYITIVLSLILALGYILLRVFNTNMIIVFFSAGIIGLGFMLGFTYYYMRSSIVVPLSKASYAMAATNIGAGAGLFVAPYLYLIGEKLFGCKTISECCLYIGIASAVIAIVYAVFCLKEGNGIVDK